MAIDPHGSLTQLRGVGPQAAQGLAKLGLNSPMDLLLHLPFRYQDRSKVSPIADIQSGTEALIVGQIMSTRVLFGRQRSLEVVVRDDTGELKIRFFNFSKYQQAALDAATYIQAFGSVRFFGKQLTMSHPEYRTFEHPPPPPKPELTPVYPATQGLSQQRIRKLCQQLCALPWPDTPGTPYQNLRTLHAPTDLDAVAPIQQQLAIDELSAFYILMKGRALKRSRERATALTETGPLASQLSANVGFELTKAQQRVCAEITSDLTKPLPMLRLVQGDVGSGKTIVAAFAAIRATENEGQTALMAPTELLAEQHAQNFKQWLQPLGIHCVLLTGQMPAKQQREALAEVAEGTARVVIGTHALFQDRVEFKNLLLVIIDEQHRFGVYQRMSLQGKGGHPHQLVMTATPIPRTLTMTLYADMDVSVIDELPKGRQPITTHTVSQDNRPKLVERLDKVLTAGQQGFWVCTLIEDSDEIDAQSAQSTFDALSQALPKHRIALLHGRMKGDEKVAIMQAFKRHDIDLLVATTVVEVGVDVPNATQMVIENSERLGLAQLHQLRGRVGRGELASRCFLLFKPGLSAAAKHRLNAMRESQDGFYLAEQDLKLRGPGDILGTRQAGEESFRIADLSVHAHLMPEVVRRSEALMAAAPGSAEHVELQQLLTMWAPADDGHLHV
jgi:ATP-dependent DNA helicase RecG